MRRIYRRTTGGHNITTIHGESINIYLAKVTHCCLYCLSDLEIVGAGLKCSKNRRHYGMIRKKIAEQLTRSDIMKTMAELFPNQSGIIRGGIDLVDGPRVLTIKDVTAVEKRRFQSRDTETVCLIHFKEIPLKLRIPVTYGRLLYKAYGVPENWIGKRVKVFDNWENIAGEDQIVARLQPTNEAANIDISAMTKTQLLSHCKNTLKVWNSPYNPKKLGQLMAYVLGQANLTKKNFEPQAAYDEMSSTGVALHRFLNSLDNYDYGLEWLSNQYEDSGLIYSPDDEETIRQSIIDSMIEPTLTDEEKFYNIVMAEIPFYSNHAEIEAAMKALGTIYTRDEQDERFVELLDYAKSQADLEADN